MCQPSSIVRIPQTTTSSMSSIGKMKPAANAGKKVICNASVASATANASHSRRAETGVRSEPIMRVQRPLTFTRAIPPEPLFLNFKLPLAEQRAHLAAITIAVKLNLVHRHRGEPDAADHADFAAMQGQFRNIAVKRTRSSV